MNNVNFFSNKGSKILWRKLSLILLKEQKIRKLIFIKNVKIYINRSYSWPQGLKFCLLILGDCFQNRGYQNGISGQQKLL